MNQGLNQGGRVTLSLSPLFLFVDWYRARREHFAPLRTLDSGAELPIGQEAVEIIDLVYEALKEIDRLTPAPALPTKSGGAR